MSEYQFVTFRAVDAPLDDKQLAFAERQSSRAEVTRWSLTCEYDYSSFRGDVDGLLRHGYDVYLQYTDYGCREIRLRLPRGLSFAKSVWSKYVDNELLRWNSDAKGSGGILTVCPFHESLDYVWEDEEYLDEVIWIRDRLLKGDLRALYVLWLCAAGDENYDPRELIEPPVPHGIAAIAKHCEELLSFFGLDPLSLLAAGEDLPDAPPERDRNPVDHWLSTLDEQLAKERLRRLLDGDTASEKARLLAEIRDSASPADWPTTNKQRSFDELRQRTVALRELENEKQAREALLKAQRDSEKAKRQRASRLKEMAKAPDKWLAEAARLVDARGTLNYKAAAETLYDLREAIGGTEGDQLARRHAAKLMKKYPSLNHLKAALRKRGLLE